MLNRNWLNKLKAEYVEEKQGILLAGKPVQCQQEILVKIGETLTPTN